MNVSDSIYLYVIVSALTVSRVFSQFSHSDNEIPDAVPSDRDVVCDGFYSENGLSLSGSQRFWYEGMRSHYTGCTYVTGNLLLTWFTDSNITYDFNFLRNIRYVRGYVLIAVSNPRIDLPLVNLEIIRANKTHRLPTGRRAGLAILLTNFTTIRLPNLKEISNGDVVSTKNAAYQHIETSRSWDDIMRGRASSDPASLQVPAGNEPDLWFEDSSDCPASCPHRCYRFRMNRYRCCSDECAGRCSGRRAHQCERCRDYSQYGECVSHCSDPYIRDGWNCVYNPWYNGGRERNVQI